MAWPWKIERFSQFVPENTASETADLLPTSKQHGDNLDTGVLPIFTKLPELRLKSVILVKTKTGQSSTSNSSGNCGCHHRNLFAACTGSIRRTKSKVLDELYPKFSNGGVSADAWRITEAGGILLDWLLCTR